GGNRRGAIRRQQRHGFNCRKRRRRRVDSEKAMMIGKCPAVQTLRGVLVLAAAIAVTSAFAGQAETVPDDGRVTLYRGARPRDGGRLSFTWKQIEGPSVKIADPTASRVVKDADGKDKWI